MAICLNDLRSNEYDSLGGRTIRLSIGHLAVFRCYEISCTKAYQKNSQRVYRGNLDGESAEENHVVMLLRDCFGGLKQQLIFH